MASPAKRFVHIGGALVARLLGPPLDRESETEPEARETEPEARELHQAPRKGPCGVAGGEDCLAVVACALARQPGRGAVLSLIDRRFRIVRAGIAARKAGFAAR